IRLPRPGHPARRRRGAGVRGAPGVLARGRLLTGVRAVLRPGRAGGAEWCRHRRRRPLDPTVRGLTRTLVETVAGGRHLRRRRAGAAVGRAGVRLTPTEQDTLLLFTAAELAKARRARGCLLNAPEATALVANAVVEAARDGVRHGDAVAIGQRVLTREERLPGVAEIVGDVSVEAVFDDGTRLVVVPEPFGPAPEVDTEGLDALAAGRLAPGTVLPSAGARERPSQAVRERPGLVIVEVVNTG